LWAWDFGWHDEKGHGTSSLIHASSANLHIFFVEESWAEISAVSNYKKNIPIIF
jgi:hypothetical protein